MSFKKWMTASLMTVGIAGCGGGGSTEPGAGMGDGTALDGMCTEGTGSATAFDTCHELERVGGLALTSLRLQSLGFSTAHDRAAILASTSGSQACPDGGSVVASSESAGAVIRMTFTDCDFGLGPMSGTVVAEDMSSGDSTSSDQTVEVDWGDVVYVYQGTVFGIGNTGPQVSGSGSIEVGTQPAQLMDFLGAYNPEPDGVLAGAFRAQHRVDSATGIVLANDSFDGAEKSRLEERGKGFVIVDLPYTGFARYTRVYGQPDGLRFETADARLEINEREIAGSLTNSSTGTTEDLSSTWDEVMSRPRYDFAD